MLSFNESGFQDITEPKTGPAFSAYLPGASCSINSIYPLVNVSLNTRHVFITLYSNVNFTYRTPFTLISLILFSITLLKETQLKPDYIVLLVRTNGYLLSSKVYIFNSYSNECRVVRVAVITEHNVSPTIIHKIQNIRAITDLGALSPYLKTDKVKTQ